MNQESIKEIKEEIKKLNNEIAELKQSEIITEEIINKKKELKQNVVELYFAIKIYRKYKQYIIEIENYDALSLQEWLVISKTFINKECNSGLFSRFPEFLYVEQFIRYVIHWKSTNGGLLNWKLISIKCDNVRCTFKFQDGYLSIVETHLT